MVPDNSPNMSGVPAEECLAAFVLLLFVCEASCIHQRAPDPLPGFPRLILWAWERPESLTFIVPRSTGVAYLAGTLSVGDNKFTWRPRMQPLFLPPATPLIAVFRIETRNDKLPPASEVSDKIVESTKGVPVGAVQIDFDAPAWAREFYRSLLVDLRQKLPERVALEMTALVSWCEADDWIRGLPVADTVPMFFRMGIDPHSRRRNYGNRCAGRVLVFRPASFTST
jgi:Protein of unknown function (DUF3142)